MTALMAQPTATSDKNRLLGSPEIRRMLSEFVRRRVPEADADDVVQTVLVEALSSERMPEERTELRKWLTGVARHKIADLHRKRGRERPEELPEIETSPPPVEEHEMVRWAEREAKKSSKDADATLRWMAREGEGDKLEHIAAEEKLPAATVRQRVSRMRRWMKERWLAELTAAAMLGILAFVVYRFVLSPKSVEVVREDAPTPGPSSPLPPVAPSPIERAAELRKQALPLCTSDARACLQKLDEAKRLDATGDAAPEVQAGRKEAERALAPQTSAVPVPDPTAVPQSSAVPQSTTPSVPPTARPTATSLPPKDQKGPSKAAPKGMVKPSSPIDWDSGSMKK